MKKQHVFWVASAPLSADGHVNVSTKGLRGTFHVANAKRVWYEDMAGSGSETISHVRENGRITILFNAFEGPPRIARLHGKGVYEITSEIQDSADRYLTSGTVCEFGTPQYNELLPPDDRHPGSRSIIVIDVERVSTRSSRRFLLQDCYTAQDQMSQKVVPKKGLRQYLSSVNSKSIDGLPAITIAQEANRGPLNPMLGTFPRIKPTSTPEDKDTSGKVMAIVDVTFWWISS
ncbi:hypothetical protein D9757_011417 [Collybiopsis confluens]|uniref:Pyridoxamine 5'-phosphate oxidase putative domain-containing protein n=1 Tax=Collybiopsis confluens TaxID=2823264 RepID=A0A8H5G8J0_9AGAR|nr:hypothetical protein D9757_011417 [Collybiopsis confluens]